MLEISKKDLARWIQKAEKLDESAHDLFSDMIRVLGEDNHETDFPDAVCERVTELLDMLDRRMKMHS